MEALLRLYNAGLTSSHIPLHALDEHLHHLITRIRNWRQAMETGAFLGCLDGPIDELNLVHSSTYQVHTNVRAVHTEYILVHTCVGVPRER